MMNEAENFVQVTGVIYEIPILDITCSITASTLTYTHYNIIHFRSMAQ